jgi:hypothetical protein
MQGSAKSSEYATDADMQQVDELTRAMPGLEQPTSKASLRVIYRKVEGDS